MRSKKFKFQKKGFWRLRNKIFKGLKALLQSKVFYENRRSDELSNVIRFFMTLYLLKKCVFNLKSNIECIWIKTAAPSQVAGGRNRSDLTAARLRWNGVNTYMWKNIYIFCQNQTKTRGTLFLLANTFGVLLKKEIISERVMKRSLSDGLVNSRKWISESTTTQQLYNIHLNKIKSTIVLAECFFFTRF